MIEYELYLRTWSHLNPNAKAEWDYETIDFVRCENYREAIKRAKKISKRIPYVNSSGQEIVQVQVCAYFAGCFAKKRYGTTYHLVWKEIYENGKNKGRYYE